MTDDLKAAFDQWFAEKQKIGARYLIDFGCQDAFSDGFAMGVQSRKEVAALVAAAQAALDIFDGDETYDEVASAIQVAITAVSKKETP